MKQEIDPAALAFALAYVMVLALCLWWCIGIPVYHWVVYRLAKAVFLLIRWRNK